MSSEAQGWQSGKFTIKHYRRGDLLDGEAFALVPERDPAALVALSAYAAATPDLALAAKLNAWVEEIARDQGMATIPTAPDPATMGPSWVATLAAEVEREGIPIETALFRMLNLARGIA
tara:strand:+ start:1714 stop:2070 length:357 start_codon:yes stop_codon:yes gene_type:complete